jgi:large subunit ribosomal protein L13
MSRRCLFLDEGSTYVFDANGLIMGRLASVAAKTLLSAARDGRQDRVIIINSEKAIVSGNPQSIFEDYLSKYRLNHSRKGPFFPRMPDLILKRTVRGMLPYQKKSSGRRAFKALRVEIGCPSHLSGEDLPEGHLQGDTTSLERPLPERYVRLGEISAVLGAPASRWNGGEA